MVTSRHEAAHQVFRDHPGLLEPAFQILGLPFPASPVVEVAPSDVNDMRPVERRVDTVLRVRSPDAGDLLLAIESQLRRDDSKVESWAYYVSYMTARFGTPTLLIVVCQDGATADWAARPLKLRAAGWTVLTVNPLVLGPHNVPRITDAGEAAEKLSLATLSAIIHGRSTDSRPILEALAHALAKVPEDIAESCVETIEAALLKSRALELWRSLVSSYVPVVGGLVWNYRETIKAEAREEGLEEGRAEGREEGLEEGRAEGLAQGKAQGKAQDLLEVMTVRGFQVSDDDRQRILACTDLPTLDRWFSRSLRAASTAEVFDDDPSCSCDS
ncbi:hypothetical protein ACTWP5_01140 [Streptomyces sp. 4N509B]|uniref:hypothetical protein n=1 Tax=Streptomyces sp. 4N509B TaxID=3457413 RepID=UPI003FCFCDA6